MTTDPRLAPLAAALHGLHCGDVIHSDYRHDHDDDAAATLAALPPDWCVHDPHVVFDAKAFAAVVVQRDRMTDMVGTQQAEIARLRAIEEAAQAAVATLERPTELHDYRGGYHRSPDCPGCLLLAALRAALGSER